MYIVRSGKVRVLKQEAGATIELGVLGPGSVLGELSLLNKEPSTATAPESLARTTASSSFTSSMRFWVSGYLYSSKKQVLMPMPGTMLAHRIMVWNTPGS
ncbi:MAG: cyclic nucleotide-binding domain-containing protein [Planctomycetota bacterium]